MITTFEFLDLEPLYNQYVYIVWRPLQPYQKLDINFCPTFKKYIDISSI